MNRLPRRLMLGWALAGAVACTPKASDSPDASVEPSPNASILPAPLNSGTHSRTHVRAHVDAGAKVSLLEGGVVVNPTVLRDDEALTADEGPGKDLLGLELEAAFYWPDLPHPLALPDAPQDVARRVREATALGLRIALAHVGRMRLDIVGHGFAVPAGTELRARPEYYGTLLVWPGGTTYRTLIPGMLRALFEEGRTDVVPLIQPKITRQAGETLLGQKTERVEVDTPMGKLLLDQASNPAAGSSAQLLCRMLIELIGSELDADVCDADAVPLAAEYHWAEGGRLAFEVTSVNKKSELAFDSLTVPPSGASFRVGELPARPSEPLLDAATLAQLHGHAGRTSDAAPTTAPKALVLTNHTDSGRYFLLDGVPLIWVRARAEGSVTGVKPGHYNVAWRDFYATQVSAPAASQLPARLSVGTELDAGKGP